MGINFNVAVKEKNQFLNECYIILGLILPLLTFLAIEYLWTNTKNSIFGHHEVVEQTDGNT